MNYQADLSLRFFTMLAFLIAPLLLPLPLLAQEENEYEKFFEMSLEELLDVKIILASKKEESIFDSPLSASVITKEQIDNAGATSIPDALRLIPGIIVREQSAGNFDIHIRGFDNVPPHTSFTSNVNSITLVMIDNRPIYNYFNGATFWETLPIDLGDVEKIEVVRGPSSALYGPNAASGVINIITRNAEIPGFHINSNYQTGNYGTQIGNVSFDYLADRISIRVSANKEARDRHQEEYYEFYRDMYVPDAGSVLVQRSGAPFSNVAERYPDQTLAVDKFGINSFILYRPSDEVSFDLSFGLQESDVQKIFVDNAATPLTTNESQTKYFDSKLNAFGFTGRISWLGGEQKTNGVSGYQYDFNTLDMGLEYEYQWNDLILRPGISYRKAVYDGENIGGSQELMTYAGSLRSDYTLNKTRLVAAVRGDKYNHPDKTYLSYQLAATHKLNEDNLLRMVYSRANRSPSMIRTYTDSTFWNGPTQKFEFLGNKNLELLEMELFELGFRSKLKKNILLDIEAFIAETQNYDDIFVTSEGYTDSIFVRTRQYRNIDISARQLGLTASVKYIFGKKLQVSVFGTVQKTDVYDFRPDDSEPDLVDLENKATPEFYGGMNVNYRPFPKMNINLNSYYLSKQTFLHFLGEDDLESKFVTNLKISYNFNENMTVYLNARNVFNEAANEYAFADEVEAVYLAGVKIKF